MEETKLNQDLLDQLPGSTPKPKRSAEWKLEDNNSDVGYVYTTTRGYELFMFHYHRHEKPEPICNRWKLNLGKLVVPNIYVNVDLLKLLAQNYDSKKRAICDRNGKPCFFISREAISEVFNLLGIYNYPIVLVNSLEEYQRLDTTYAAWRLPFHLLNLNAPLEIGEGLAFHVNLF